MKVNCMNAALIAWPVGRLAGAWRFLVIGLVFSLMACQGDIGKPEPAVDVAHGSAIEARAKDIGLATDWCKGHALPESMCTKCNPELTQEFKQSGDWCAEHEFPESACPQCNPMEAPGRASSGAKEIGRASSGAKEIGRASSGAKDIGVATDWCKGHALPESMCTKCNPELTQDFKEAGDWCAEHEFPESACPQCNPMEAPGRASSGAMEIGIATDWCVGHALPESMCTKCNPELTEQFKEAGDWCAEHELPESACPQCNPRVPPGVGLGGIAPGTIIRFKSPAIEAAAGIEVVPVQRARLSRTIEAPSEVIFDQDRLAEIRAPIPGILRELSVQPGQSVSKGEALFVLESAEVGNLQADQIAAQERKRAAEAALSRLTMLEEQGVASLRQIEEARGELAAASSHSSAIEQALRLAGGSGNRGSFTLTTPISGTIIRRDALLGAWVEPSKPLATVADTRFMWTRLSVPPMDALSISPGQSVRISVPELGSKSFLGEVLWVAPELDPKSRTVSVTARVDNREGLLKAHLFGTARIEVSPAVQALVVPESAVQQLEDAHVIFVQMAQGTYEPRVIEVGKANDGRVQVYGDLKVGLPVVTVGAFLLRTELDKGAIGAGCCEVDGPGGM